MEIKKFTSMADPTIVLFDSLETYYNKTHHQTEFSYRFATDQGDFNKIIIYSPNLTNFEIEEQFLSDPKISEVAFLTNYTEESIELTTAYFFSPGKCHQNEVKTINRFWRRNQSWENSNFYPEKFNNFHGCTLQVWYNGLFQIGKRIYGELSQQLNFTIQREYYDKTDLELKDTSEKLSENIFRQYIDKSGLIAPLSTPLFFHAYTLAVPPGEPYTDLERMFAAFDYETWIGIVVTFIIAIVVILVIKSLPKTVQNFVFGREVRTPLLNLFDVFINGGQNVVPSRNFARYLLMMFILWSLIFRTCYQSKMFEFLNSDMRHPRLQTIEEVIEKNYTLVYIEGQSDYVLDTFFSK